MDKAAASTELLESMYRHKTELMVAFRYFALTTASEAVVENLAASGEAVGGKTGGPSGDTIDRATFVSFAKVSK